MIFRTTPCFIDNSGYEVYCLHSSLYAYISNIKIGKVHISDFYSLFGKVDFSYALALSKNVVGAIPHSAAATFSGIFLCFHF